MKILMFVLRTILVFALMLFPCENRVQAMPQISVLSSVKYLTLPLRPPMHLKPVRTRNKPLSEHQLLVNDVVYAASEFDVPSGIMISQVYIESQFNPHAIGSNDDLGLLQITEPTAYAINRIHFHIPGFYPWMLMNPKLNCEFAAFYLSYLYRNTKSWVAAVTAYNNGLGGEEQTGPYSLYFEHVNSVHVKIYKQSITP